MAEATETPEGRRLRWPRATLEQRVMSALKASQAAQTDAALAGRLRETLHSVAAACADLAAVGRVQRYTGDGGSMLTRIR